MIIIRRFFVGAIAILGVATLGMIVDKYPSSLLLILIPIAYIVGYAVIEG